MADKNNPRTDAGWPQENDAFSHKLDAALAEYAAVEPRAGLEQRILANLRAEQFQTPDRARWRWAVAGTVAAVMVVTLALLWRSDQPSERVVANHSKAAVQDSKESGTQVAAHNSVASRPRTHVPIRRASANRLRTAAVAANGPKLDQFPSPQPLSEQEKILASYVSQDPEHAALIAQARMEVLRRDREEELQEAGTNRARNSQPH